MDKIIELIERMVDIWCMKRMLKYIDKEIELCNKHQKKANHHKQVARKLIEDYNESYPESKEKEGAEK